MPTGPGEMPAVFPFVVGFPRSGTTVVRAMLNAHPDLAIPPEGWFTVHLAWRRQQYEGPGRLAAERLLDDLWAHYWFRLWKLDPRAVREAVIGPGVTTWADAIRAIYRLWALGQGKPRYGDKTAASAAVADLASAFPEARIVHLVRDGRDVALANVERWADRSVPKTLAAWQTRVSAGRRAGAKIGAERYLEIRYEDLVRQPEPVLRQLCGFFALPFDPSMLRYHEHVDQVLATVPDPWQHQRVTQPLTLGVRDWRAEMSTDHQGVASVIAGDLLGDLGYEPGPARPTLRARAAVGRLWWDRQAQRARTSARARLARRRW